MRWNLAGVGREGQRQRGPLYMEGKEGHRPCPVTLTGFGQATRHGERCSPPQLRPRGPAKSPKGRGRQKTNRTSQNQGHLAGSVG